MAHQRTLIRQAVIALLKSANTAAGARVDDTRIKPHDGTKLPALSVYTLKEPVDEGSAQTAPRWLTRQLQLEITGWVAHRDSYPAAQAMDDLAAQIEAAMDADRFLGGLPNGLAEDTVLVDTDIELVESNGGSDPTVGIVTLTYTVTYRTSQGATATDDFLRANVEDRIVGAVDANAATDLINVRTP